jgi:hypothetical protein
MQHQNKLIYQDSEVTKFLIESPKHGKVECIVDTEDWEKISKILWYISKSKDRFYYLYSNKYKYRLSRFIANINNSKILVDHINHNTFDNRKCNLRICTNQQNQWNSEPNQNNTSGYKGVYWYKRDKKWRSQIRLNNIQYWLGNFTNKKCAACAYNNKAKELFGEFAYLNKI